MSDTYYVKMPQLSDTMTEGVMVSWEKEVGDRVARGDIVATVETDKAIMDVEVFREGYLSGPLAEIGATVPVGEPIGAVVAASEQVTDAEAAPGSAEGAGPAARPGAAPDTPSSSPAGTRPPEGVVYTINMPQLSDTMTEGVLVSWEKGVGEKIERGDTVATVETDKAVMDVEVFREGYLSGPMLSPGSVAPVGGELAFLVARPDQVRDDTMTGALETRKSLEPSARARQDAAAPSVGPVDADAAPPAPRPHAAPATPYARKLAGQLGIDLNALSGSGPAGEITAGDVESAGAATPAAGPGGAGRAMSAMERAISRNMAATVTMPTFRVTVNARPEALARAAKRAGVSVTVAIAKACAVAMGEHPRVNWAYQPEDRLVERDRVDIGMAVAADDGGLVVPVLRDCGARSVATLDGDWKDLVTRARNRRLKPEEYADPTFMVSNMGMLGVSHFDAIPTPGTAAILAIAAAGEQGMPLTVTADHRVVNGAQVAQFLNSLRQVIEHPDRWMGPAGPAIPEGDWDYDVVVIGGGPGGEDCARELVEHGLKVAMVNDAPLPGGECLWRGCIPSKAWRAAADRMRDRAHDARLGVEGTAEPRLGWRQLEQTRREVLDARGRMAHKADTGMKIKFIHGFAAFEDDHHIFVDTSGNDADPHRRAARGDGSTGERLSFGCAVIATGAPPYVPPIPGAREGLDGGVLTSDTVWGLTEMPGRLVVVGGGAIGLEMAQIFQDFGARVTLLEARDRILAEVEQEIAKQLTAVLEEEPRLEVRTSVKIGEITGAPGAMEVSYVDADGGQHKAGGDYVVIATGKRPVLEPLALARAGVAVADGAIEVGPDCRTSVPHIFAVGDVVGGLMLAHTAGRQGRVAAASITGERARYDQSRDCGVIFTRPQAAFVGLSVAQARERDIDAVEAKMPISIDAKAMINNETHGLIKIVADQATHRVIGVHFLADHADTLIGEGVMMVAGGLTLEQVAEAIHPHPTQTELFGDMARRLLSRLRRSRRRQAGARAASAVKSEA